MTNKPRILLVASEAAQEVLRPMIDEDKYRLVLTTSGLDAIRIIEEKDISLLIASCEIIDFDGWKLTRLIRSNIFQYDQVLPIILLTENKPTNLPKVTIRDFGINSLLTRSELPQLSSTIEQLIAEPGLGLEVPTALLVEDNKNNAQLIKKILSNRFEVEIATDGLMGLEAWKERKHDLVLLDVMLPKMAGPAVLTEMMKIDPGQVVIVITAHGTSQMAQDMMMGGASDFVTKPFRADELRLIAELAIKRKDFMAWVSLCNTITDN